MLFVRDLKDIPHVLVAESAKKLNDLTRFFFFYSQQIYLHDIPALYDIALQ